jgi:hypothetical protein
MIDPTHFVPPILCLQSATTESQKTPPTTKVSDYGPIDRFRGKTPLHSGKADPHREIA